MTDASHHLALAAYHRDRQRALPRGPTPGHIQLCDGATLEAKFRAAGARRVSIDHVLGTPVGAAMVR